MSAYDFGDFAEDVEERRALASGRQSQHRQDLQQETGQTAIQLAERRQAAVSRVAELLELGQQIAQKTSGKVGTDLEIHRLERVRGLPAIFREHRLVETIPAWNLLTSNAAPFAISNSREESQGIGMCDLALDTHGGLIRYGTNLSFRARIPRSHQLITRLDGVRAFELEPHYHIPRLGNSLNILEETVETVREHLIIFVASNDQIEL